MHGIKDYVTVFNVLNRYVFRFEMPPFAFPKMASGTLKCGILEGERPPLEMRYVMFV